MQFFSGYEGQSDIKFKIAWSRNVPSLLHSYTHDQHIQESSREFALEYEKFYQWDARYEVKL